MLRFRPLLLASLSLILVACGKAPEAVLPEISAARISLPPPGAPMAAGYFELRNPGTMSVSLHAVSSPAFGAIEIHETVEVDGMSRMRQMEKVAIPGGERVSFEPGGRHLMLMASTLGADAPTAIPVELHFQAADGTALRLATSFAVESAGERADDHAHHHH